MNNPNDVLPASETQTYAAAPEGLPPVEDAGSPDLHQEINERRARVENAELLQHLRGL
jgi:hypothetical protein